jgi:hypothetical protein
MKTMDINWHITADDKACVEAILEKQHNTWLVRDRYERNLAETKPEVTQEEFWKQMVCTRLTTLALESPGDKLDTFECLSPFPLAYDTMGRQQSREEFIYSTVSAHRVGTYRKRISKELANNFKRLEDGEWPHALDRCNRLTIRSERQEIEADVADYIDDTFEGFGPKQSRNLLQALGLTRFEIPIDSRVTNWLNDELKFPFRVTPTALSDRHCYRLILDAVCKLCAECNTFPCVLDAAIFSAQDKDE